MKNLEYLLERTVQFVDQVNRPAFTKVGIIVKDSLGRNYMMEIDHISHSVYHDAEGKTDVIWIVAEEAPEWNRPSNYQSPVFGPAPTGSDNED